MHSEQAYEQKMTLPSWLKMLVGEQQKVSTCPYLSHVVVGSLGSELLVVIRSGCSFEITTYEKDPIAKSLDSSQKSERTLSVGIQSKS